MAAVRVTRVGGVRRQLADLLIEMLNAETGQRGFVLTGQDAFLEPYSSALIVIDKTYADLRQLTSDNPNQGARGS